jgi:hypothetical protein
LVAAVAVLAACSKDQRAEAPPTPTSRAQGGSTETLPLQKAVLSVEDLAAMTLPQEELGPSSAGLTFDWFFGGFEDNEERARDKSSDPDGERKDLTETGRLAGYLNMYVPDRGPAPDPIPEPESGALALRPPPPTGVQRVFTLAHLFGDAAGASSYLHDSTEEARQEVGKAGSDGSPQPTSAREEFPVEGLGDEAMGSVTRGSSEGMATRIAFRRGRVLGVAQLVRNDEGDDRAEVVKIAERFHERIEAVLAGRLRGYQGDAESVVGVDQLIAMPLPKERLPRRYAPFGDDVTAGRFQDNEERLRTTSLDADDDRADDERFGRVVGYSGAYSSDFAAAPTRTTGFARTGVEIFGDAARASQWLADQVQDEQRLAGQTRNGVSIRTVTEFPVQDVGEEAAGLIRRTSTGDVVMVVFRRGRLVGSVVLGPPGGDERMSEAIALAGALDDRMRAILKSLSPPVAAGG